MAKDYYRILGVGKNATKDEIKRAYKELAKKYHPDLNKESGATDKFKEINEAASVLGDDQKRANYDRFGTTAEDFGRGFSGDASDFMSDIGGFGFDFDSIFDSFFGGGFSGGGGRRRSKRGHARPGNDLQYDLTIELEEVFSGAEREISFGKLEHCDSCGGTGAESKSDMATCPDCNGSGYVRKTTRTPFGYFQQTGPCPKCGGQGRYIKNTCPECDGTGLVRKNKKLKVTIPKGSEDGMSLRIRGEGQAGEHGGEPGDLYVVLHVKAHKRFERDGDDLHIEIPLPFTTAALGGEIEVPTMQGKATLKIPIGTQTDTVFRMRGKGMPHLEYSGTGDQNVKVVVQVPEKLSKRQKEILEEFNEESKKSGFFKMFN